MGLYGKEEFKPKFKAEVNLNSKLCFPKLLQR